MDFGRCWVSRGALMVTSEPLLGTLIEGKAVHAEGREDAGTLCFLLNSAVLLKLLNKLKKKKN